MIQTTLHSNVLRCWNIPRASKGESWPRPINSCLGSASFAKTWDNIGPSLQKRLDFELVAVMNHFLWMHCDGSRHLTLKIELASLYQLLTGSSIPAWTTSELIYIWVWTRRHKAFMSPQAMPYELLIALHITSPIVMIFSYVIQNSAELIPNGFCFRWEWFLVAGINMFYDWRTVV